jgi:ABC-2 type transport system permease protein
VTRVLFRHEAGQLGRDRVCIGAALFLVISVAISIENAGRYASDQEQSLRVYKQREDERLARLVLQDAITVAKVDAGELTIPPRTNNPLFTPLLPLWASYDSQRDTMISPTPLALLAIGQSDIQPPGLRALWPGRYLYQTEPIANQTRSPLRMAIGNFDVTFVVIYLLPVIFIPFAYNLVSGERDSGTLPLLLSCGVSVERLLLTKLLIRMILLSVAFWLPLIGGLFWFQVELFTPDTGLAFLGWICFVLLYQTFWIALAIVVNLRGWSSAKNALVLSTFWLLLVFLVPAFCTFACSSLWPLPSPTELINRKREAMLDTRIYDIEQNREELRFPGSRINRYIATFCGNHPEIGCAPPGSRENGAFMGGATMEEIDRLTSPLTKHYDAQLRSQERAMSYLRFLSPTSVTEPALVEFAGTSVDRYRRFQRETMAAHSRWRLYFNILGYKKRDLPLHPADYAVFPYFEFRDPPMHTIVREQVVPGIYLTVVIMLLLWEALPSRKVI